MKTIPQNFLRIILLFSALSMLGGCRSSSIVFAEDTWAMGVRYTTTQCELTNSVYSGMKKYRTAGSSIRLSDSSFVLAKRIDGDDKKKVLECYNSRLNLLWSSPLEFNKKESGMRLIAIGGKVGVFYKRTNEDTLQLCLSRYDASTGKLLSQEVIFQTMDILYSKGISWMTFSPDSSKIVVTLLPTKPSDAERQEYYSGLCLVLDKNFANLQQRVVRFGETVHWNYANALDDLLPIYIDNKGDLYLAKAYTVEKTLRFSIVRYSADGSKKELTTNKGLNSFLSSVEVGRGSMLFLADGSIAHTLALMDGSQLAALAYCRANFTHDTIAAPEIIEYSKDFQYKWLGEERDMDYFRFRELVELPGGGLLAIVEQQVHKSGSSSFNNGLVYSYYLSGDILLTALSIDGKPRWVTTLGKESRNGDTEGLSYMRTEAGNEMNFWGAKTGAPGYFAYKVNTESGVKKAIAFPFVCEMNAVVFQFNRPQLLRLNKDHVACFGEDAMAFYVMFMDFSRMVR